MELTTDAYMTIPEIHGVFVDSILTDEADNLVFGSFWGRDTAIREFQGRLSLGLSEGGMTSFNVQGDNYQNEFRKVFPRIGNIESLEQMTGRVHTDILGELVHCWLYQRDIIKPDMANHRALLISMDDESLNLWNLVKTICPVPLLDHWENQLIPELYNSGMIKSLNGINQTGKQIVIDEDQMALIVKNGCLEGSLTVHTADTLL